jgi:hypothetical protein
MKRLRLLWIGVVFLFLCAQAMASPPVAPPPEGFLITSETNFAGEGKLTESEKFNWRYFEGVGNIGAETVAMRCQGDPVCLKEWYDYFSLILPVEPDVAADIADRYIQEQGFQQGAEIAYQQDYLGIDGNTVFIKNFKADSHNAPNLTVDKQIAFEASAGGKGYATHLEKVGLSVVSQGGKLDLVGGSGAGLLTLCPWAGSGNRATTRATTNNGCGGLPESGCGTPSRQGCDYPATNEGIAAGSSFKVTNITGFTSITSVTSTDVPALAYAVRAPSGRGHIEAGFVVELFEGAGCWGQRDLFCYICSDCEPAPTGRMIQDPVPPVASRVQYAEHATADGVWSFTKQVSYRSVMLGGASSGTTFPFNQVP